MSEIPTPDSLAENLRERGVHADPEIDIREDGDWEPVEVDTSNVEPDDDDPEDAGDPDVETETDVNDQVDP